MSNSIEPQALAAEYAKAPKPSRIKQILSLSALLLGLPLLLLAYALLRLTGERQAQRIPPIFHRFVCTLLGLEVVTVEGQPMPGNTLMVSNHISWIDIFALGGVVRGFFVAKSEVAGWPLLGKLAKLQNTLFIRRDGRYIRQQIPQLQAPLKAGHNLILFPEGTSTEGVEVLPFKSSLFKAADIEPEAWVQPLSIAYTHYQGKAMDRPSRLRYAWIIPMGFGGHFLTAMGLSGARCELRFGKAVKLSEFGNDASARKALAAHCQTQVARGLAKSLDQTN